tara:strand:+ start:476 stop:889 length:414 start_codon:yes stop_codon:yes gene_type:complete
MVQLSLFGPEDLPLEGDTKVCIKCKEEKPLASFSNSSGAKYKRPECRECSRELTRVREHLRTIHGMPDEGYKCPVCRKGSEEVKGKGGKSNGPWVVDHDHKTNKFRGWLCHSCNRGLGSFEDDPMRLLTAVAYVENA